MQVHENMTCDVTVLRDVASHCLFCMNQRNLMEEKEVAGSPHHWYAPPRLHGFTLYVYDLKKKS